MVDSQLIDDICEYGFVFGISLGIVVMAGTILRPFLTFSAEMEMAIWVAVMVAIMAVYCIGTKRTSPTGGAITNFEAYDSNKTPG